MAHSNRHRSLVETPLSSSICVKSPSIIRTASSPGRMIWLRRSAAVLRRHWRSSLTSTALPLLREYDGHERVTLHRQGHLPGARQRDVIPQRPVNVSERAHRCRLNCSISRCSLASAAFALGEPLVPVWTLGARGSLLPS